MAAQASLKSQAARPHGWLGRLFGQIMAWSNSDMNRSTVELLAVRPTDQVLEIGFGPGTTIALLAERAAQGFVAGVDISAVMVEQARRRNRKAVEAGRVELRRGSASALPYPDDRFDKACAVNSVQFWPDRSHDLAEVSRVLKPGGRFVVALRDPSRRGNGPLAVRGDRPDLIQTVGQQLAAAGFREACRHEAPARTGYAVYLVMEKG